MSRAPEQPALLEALAREIADACAALLGETTAAARVDAAVHAAWLATIACSGRVDGTVTVGLPEADGRRLSGLIMGMEAAPDDAVIDTVREVCGQAIGSLGQKEIGRGITWSVGEVRQAPPAAIGAEVVVEFTLSSGTRCKVLVAGALEGVAAEAAAGATVDAGTAADESGPAQAPSRPESGRTAVPTQNLNVLLDVELPVSVRFGQTELPLMSLVRLGPGSVIDLRRTADEPVDVLVSGKVIARGEVVVVDGNYGVRVTEIVSAAERIRTLGA